jgi:antitoxin CptB
MTLPLFDQSQRDHSNVRCKRLLFRCWHRGTQESDLILGVFAESSLTSFDNGQLDRFEALLDCTDLDLFDWILNDSEPPPQHDNDVTRQLRDFWGPASSSTLANGQLEPRTGAACHGTSAITLHVPDLVPLPDHLSSLHSSPPHRNRPGRRLDPAGLLAVAVAAGGELFAKTHAFIVSPVGMALLFLCRSPSSTTCATAFGISPETAATASSSVPSITAATP